MCVLRAAARRCHAHTNALMARLTRCAHAPAPFVDGAAQEQKKKRLARGGTDKDKARLRRCCACVCVCSPARLSVRHARNVCPSQRLPHAAADVYSARSPHSATKALLTLLKADPAKRDAVSVLVDAAHALSALPIRSVGSGERRTVEKLCRTGGRLDAVWKAHASAHSETTFERAQEALLPPLLKMLEPFMVAVPKGSVVHFTCPPCHAGAPAPLLPLLKALADSAAAEWGVQCVVSPIERTVAQPRAKERPRARSEAELDAQAQAAADSMNASKLAQADFVVIVDNVIATGTTFHATRVSVVRARGIGAVTKFLSIAIAEGVECAALPYVASALPSI
jgi:hypothetical protein